LGLLIYTFSLEATLIYTFGWKKCPSVEYQAENTEWLSTEKCAPNTADRTVIKKESPKRSLKVKPIHVGILFKSGEPLNVLLLALVFCQNEIS